MGEEVSDYIGRLVPAMQAAYGVAWNIEARGESPTIDDRAWQVQVGYSDFQPRRNGVLGLQMTMTCAATISYVGKGPTTGLLGESRIASAMNSIAGCC